MKKRSGHKVAPDFASKQKEALVRRNRVTVLLNDKELDALKRYQALLKGKSRMSICREAIMEKVLIGLDENQPTLF